MFIPLFFPSHFLFHFIARLWNRTSKLNSLDLYVLYIICVTVIYEQADGGECAHEEKKTENVQDHGYGYYILSMMI